MSSNMTTGSEQGKALNARAEAKGYVHFMQDFCQARQTDTDVDTVFKASACMLDTLNRVATSHNRCLSCSLLALNSHNCINYQKVSLSRMMKGSGHTTGSRGWGGGGGGATSLYYKLHVNYSIEHCWQKGSAA